MKAGELLGRKPSRPLRPAGLTTRFAPHRSSAAGFLGVGLPASASFPTPAGSGPVLSRALARHARRCRNPADCGAQGFDVRKPVLARTVQLQRFLLEAEHFAQPRKRKVARCRDAGFPLDFLPMHLDAGNFIGDFIRRHICRHPCLPVVLHAGERVD